MRGQSTTEFVVLALVLTPLLFAVPLLGKYLDLTHHASQASRYAAFEISVRGPVTVKNEATVAAEARRSFSARPTRRSRRTMSRVIFSACAIHCGPTFEAIISCRALPTASRQEPAVTRDVPSRTVALFAGENGFKLPEDNLYTARVNLFPEGPRDFRFWSDNNPGVDLRMNRQTGILIDAWNAASDDVVRDKIENAGPSSPPILMPSFNPNIMRNLIDNAAALGPYPIWPLKLEGQTLGLLPQLLGEPRPRFGEHDPNIVPCDRLDPPC